MYPVICRELIEVAQKEIIEEDVMDKFKPDQKDIEAMRIAREECFKVYFEVKNLDRDYHLYREAFF